jgi:hypothetical protein
MPSLNDMILLGTYSIHLTIALGSLAESNQLNGPIPEELSKLSMLERLDLNYNSLTGTLPSTLLDELCPPIKRLHLFQNQISGSIPNDWTLGPSGRVLDGLALSDNAITGTIPPIIGTKVRELYLHENLLTGPLPEDMFRAGVLQFLNLSENRVRVRPSMRSLESLQSHVDVTYLTMLPFAIALDR